MKYVQVVCFLFAFTQIKSAQVASDNNSSPITAENITSISDLLKNLNEDDRVVKAVKNVYFDSDSIKKYFKGLKKDLDGQLVMTNHTVADFKSSPHIRQVNVPGFNWNYTFDSNEFELFKLRIADRSANYGKILGYSATQQNTYSSGQSTISYSIARYVIEKQAIKIAQDGLIINGEFYDEIQRALSSSSLNLSKARKLLAILQKYGWYVPLHFKIGGTFYVTDSKTISNPEEAKGNAMNLINCFKLAVKREANVTQKSPPWCKRFQQINENMTTDMLEETLRDRKQWKIVQYKRLLPTLLLLKNYNNSILSLCIKLLSEFRIDLQNEEADINVREYSTNIEQLLYNNQ
ncbi:hypothetical protein M5D96_002521 [Drosophila gunungcola]|uniref:MACPF domain-containing protein n=1 Tax=Drosophila gunungcola TaxID=103775 RepID=A0A9P9Z0Z7_9MUSC|nr:hypothetical protein M5D96_002521 [Drosophila gunungcola]